jgi:hypothetical protein
MAIDIILEPDITPEQITELGLLAESAGVNRLWTRNYAQARDAACRRRRRVERGN